MIDRQTIDAYDKGASIYDDEVASFWDRSPDTILQRFCESLPEHGSVLDVGCGSGRDGLLLLGRGFQVQGIDASAGMVALCNEKGLAARTGDFAALPFKDDEFDGVWSYTALLHVPKTEIAAALYEIRRVLKRGGVFGWGMIEGEGEGYKKNDNLPADRWFSYYRKSELEELLSEAGLIITYFEAFQPRSRTYLNFIARKQ